MLSLQDFGVAFGERVVLDSITQEIHAPGCTVLLGPSGTGKSTLMRTLAGFNHANPSLRTWGSVRCGLPGGECCVRPALVMQNSRLLVSTVQENLVCNLLERAAMTPAQQMERIAPLLEEAGWAQLLGKLLQKVVECSLGEQRVIAMLRCALSNPPLIMVDEPTTGLQAEGCSQVLDLLSHLSLRFGVLVVLHNLMEARRVANRVILLANGQVQEAAWADAFFSQPSTACGRLFLATGSCPEQSRPPPDASAGEISPANKATRRKAPPASPASQSLGPRGFLWVIPGKLAGTPWPGIVQEVHFDLGALKAVGVTHLIALTENPFDTELLRGYGIHSTHSPMPDMHPPTEDQAWTLCNLIDSLITGGKTVAVHCRAGLGRTGTVLTAYWLWLARGSLSAVKALEDMRRIEPLWVQSQSQVDFLEAFAITVAKRALKETAQNEMAGSAGHPTLVSTVHSPC